MSLLPFPSNAACGCLPTHCRGAPADCSSNLIRRASHISLRLSLLRFEVLVCRYCMSIHVAMTHQQSHQQWWSWRWVDMRLTSSHDTTLTYLCYSLGFRDHVLFVIWSCLWLMHKSAASTCWRRACQYCCRVLSGNALHGCTCLTWFDWCHWLRPSTVVSCNDILVSMGCDNVIVWALLSDSLASLWIPSHTPPFKQDSQRWGWNNLEWSHGSDCGCACWRRRVAGQAITEAADWENSEYVGRVGFQALHITSWVNQVVADAYPQLIRTIS